MSTGTGWNAALLCARLGETNVTSVDVEPELTRSARARLVAAGYRPTVRTVDAAGELPAGPFDRLLATCGVSRVPASWLAALAPGGRMLVPLGAGLARIERTGQRAATGRFLPDPVFFMRLREPGGAPVAGRPPLPSGPGRESGLGVGAIADSDWRFLVSLTVPDLVWQYDLGEDRQPEAVRVWHGDGSVAELRKDGTVAEAGPRRLWAELEETWRAYQCNGRPGRERYGISIEGDGQRVWLDQPTGLGWSLTG